MSVALITGSAGLVGSECVRYFAARGLDVVGIDNDMRRAFFGDEASTDWMRRRLESEVASYRHLSHDIRDRDAIFQVFERHGSAIDLVVHTAAQPSHDWAARAPHEDFTINASGTLNLLEATRRFCPDAVFIFTSTNKVYGDTPNRLPLEARETRYEVAAGHPYAEHGIDESMSVDQCLHSFFGVSKLAADVLVQEFARYFGLKAGIFRAGCLTGPHHASAQLHGFLAYLVKCAVTREPYTIIGYEGKQVRDNIHAFDLAEAFWHFYQNPRPGEVYNIGGSRHSNCSVLEALAISAQLCGWPVATRYDDAQRMGDHIWWISDVRKFQRHYPGWSYRYDLNGILREIHETLSERLLPRRTVSTA
jgi:CDP-paratose 2-epimerase